jgi:hypothetical protein
LRRATGMDKTSRGIFIAGFVIAGLYIIAGIIPIQKLWGVNHLQYFSSFGKIIFAALLLIIFVPGAAGKIYRIAVRTGKAFGELPLPARMIALLVITAVIFYFFRVHVHSLGDGYQRVYQIEKGYNYNPTEPLDFFLHAVLYAFLNKQFAISAEKIYVFYSITCGIIFTLAIHLVRLPGVLDSTEQTTIKLLAFFTGGLQLFFGYVESYSLIYPAAVLYLLAAYRFVVEKKGLLLCSVLFAVSLVSHLMGVILVPSYIFILYLSIRHRKELSRLKIAAGFAIPALMVAILASYEIRARLKASFPRPGVADQILPFFGIDRYAAISPEHLFDILNEILLVVPVMILIIVGLLICRKSVKTRSAPSLFLWLTGAASGLFLLIFDPKLGMARDWDLFSVPTTLLALALIIHAAHKGIFRSLGRLTGTVLIALPIITTVIWFAMNSSEKAQLARAENLLFISDRGRGYSTELLAHYYAQDGKNDARALELLKTIPPANRGARVYGKIAQLLIELDRGKDALAYTRRGIAEDSSFADLYYLQGVSFYRINQPDSALFYYRLARSHNCQRKDLYLLMSLAYRKMDSLPAALHAVRTSLVKYPADPSGYFSAAYLHYAMQQYDSSLVYIKKGLRMKPDFPGGGELLELVRTAIRNKQQEQR